MVPLSDSYSRGDKTNNSIHAVKSTDTRRERCLYIWDRPSPKPEAYLAKVIDLYLRAVVDWQMGKRKKGQSVCAALQAAIIARGKPNGMVVYTGQGLQYSSNAYRKLLKDSKLPVFRGLCAPLI